MESVIYEVAHFAPFGLLWRFERIDIVGLENAKFVDMIGSMIPDVQAQFEAQDLELRQRQ
jgi:hypothetical protein